MEGKRGRVAVITAASDRPGHERSIQSCKKKKKEWNTMKYKISTYEYIVKCRVDLERGKENSLLDTPLAS